MYMYKYLNIIIYNSYKHRVFKLYNMHGVDKLSTVDYILYTKTNNGKTVDKKNNNGKTVYYSYSYRVYT